MRKFDSFWEIVCEAIQSEPELNLDRVTKDRIEKLVLSEVLDPIDSDIEHCINNLEQIKTILDEAASGMNPFHLDRFRKSLSSAIFFATEARRVYRKASNENGARQL